MASTINEQLEAADNARYKEMRQALSDFEATSAAAAPPPRHRAFYAALRSVLAQCVSEADASSRHARLAAAHRWFTARRPREQPADMDAAAAMAASLSVTASDTRPTRSNRTPGRQNGSSAGKSRGGDGNNGSASSSTAGALQRGQQRWQKQERLVRSESTSSSGSDSSGGGWTSGAGWNAAAYGDAGEEATNGFGTAAAATAAAGRRQPLKIQQPSIGRQPAIQFEARKVAPLLASDPGLLESIALLTGQDPDAITTLAFTRGSTKSGSTSMGLGASAAREGASLTSRTAEGGASAGASSDAAAAAAGTAGDVQHTQRRAGWMASCSEQQRFEADVRRRMVGYARHRARIEEEIMRRQEARRALGGWGGAAGGVRAALLHTLRAAHVQHNQGAGSGSDSSTGQQREGDGGSREEAGNGRRVLVHLDSHHQPPAMSAYVSARVPGIAQRLVASDSWVRGARRRALAEGEREVAAAAEAVGKLRGAPGGEGAVLRALLERALLPMPDQPHLTVRIDDGRGAMDGWGVLVWHLLGFWVRG